MNPVFKEYIEFLKDTSGERLPELTEGYFWLDRQIIKGFDRQGNIHKFFKVNVNNNLSAVSITIPKGYKTLNEIDLISWKDLIDMNYNHLRKMESDSFKLIKEKTEKYKGHTPLIPVSMGKDSMVVAHLVRNLYPDTKAIFNNTSLDCADTYLMVKKFPNCEIMNPSKGFYQYVESDHMIPTRFARFCCRMFKVGVMVSKLEHEHPYLMWMGMRNQESATRSEYTDEWINESEWGKTNWQGVLPIRKWTELDVWLYTLWRNLDINPKYKKGYSRVGCHCACPYYNKSTWILDKYFYPDAYRRWRNILQKDFIRNRKWLIMNCTIEEYLTQAWNGGTFRDEPTQEVVEEFARYNGLEAVEDKVVKQFFNKTCSDCKKRIKDKTTLAMNMKFHGRETTKFLCKECFQKSYVMDSEKWNYYVAAFKRDGCVLFDRDEKVRRSLEKEGV